MQGICYEFSFFGWSGIESTSIEVIYWPIVPAHIDGYDFGTICEVMIGKETELHREKPAPAMLWPPQIPHLICPRLEPGSP
jgi:hypothetical protein